MLIAASRTQPLSARIAILLAVAALEAFAAYCAAGLPDVWQISPIGEIAGRVANIGFFTVLILAGLAWPKRTAIRSAFRIESAKARISPAVSASIIACLLSLLARALLAGGTSPFATAILSSASVALDLASVVALVVVAVPWPFWSWLVRACPIESVSSAVLSVIGLNAISVLRLGSGNAFLESLWQPLADATVQLSYWMLTFIERSAFIEPGTRIIGARDFSVRIFGPCSGYEGMLVVAAFLTGYLWIFRRSLKFPRILLLVPIAMATVWLLNSFRIAMLVFIGANFSPAVALGGFHSQFGWISLLLVSLPIIILAPRMKFFAASANASTMTAGPLTSKKDGDANAGTNPVLVFLAPFIAMLAAQILINAAAPHEQGLYPLKVFTIAAALYLFRHAYARIWSSPALSSILVGVLAGALWIATDPGSSNAANLESWISATPPLALTGWFIFRAIGTIVMVPIAEELAFRGYLYRVMISSRFETVDFRSFGIVALIVSSAFFGLMHERWLAGALAGALYALLMVRRGRISDAIAAHMTTNAVIFAWAIAAGQWSLL
jgi:exosortase E/protease (VPEID-CTERM system)